MPVFYLCHSRSRLARIAQNACVDFGTLYKSAKYYKNYCAFLDKMLAIFNDLYYNTGTAMTTLTTYYCHPVERKDLSKWKKSQFWHLYWV